MCNNETVYFNHCVRFDQADQQCELDCNGRLLFTSTGEVWLISRFFALNYFISQTLSYVEFHRERDQLLLMFLLLTVEAARQWTEDIKEWRTLMQICR